MTTTTFLALTDKLPLTCSRSGTCCHGKAVWLNPWELACLAAAREISRRDFRDRYCECGGIRLRFDGPPGWQGLAACSLYRPDRGCSVHAGRPLACRLFPLGRQKQGDHPRYIHRGTHLPCLDGCPEVAELPYLSVGEYRVAQQVENGESAQDHYLELMQQLADGAFILLLETGLAATGDRTTLRLWRELGSAAPHQLAQRLGPEWIDRLMLPEIDDEPGNPQAFCQRHYALLQQQTQDAFASPVDAAALSTASGVMMGLALHLGRGLGAAPSELAAQWIDIARQHGACE